MFTCHWYTVKDVSKRLRDCIRQLENGKKMNLIILTTIRRVLLQRRTIYTLPMAAHSTTIQDLAHNSPAVSQDQSVSDDTSKAKHTMIHIYQIKSRAQTPIIIHQNHFRNTNKMAQTIFPRHSESSFFRYFDFHPARCCGNYSQYH